MAKLPVHYRVRIVGHEAPFKWEVQRAMTEDPSRYTAWSVVPDGRGEATSYADARTAAFGVATEAEWKRKHDSTESFEHLFTVRPLEPVEVPDAPPEWLNSGAPPSPPEPDVELGNN